MDLSPDIRELRKEAKKAVRYATSSNLSESERAAHLQKAKEIIQELWVKGAHYIAFEMEDRLGLVYPDEEDDEFELMEPDIYGDWPYHILFNGKPLSWENYPGEL